MTRIAIVTGANRGLGLETAKQLAARGYNVIAGSRDEAKGRIALRGIERVTVKQLDVANAASVTAFGNWLEGTHASVDALINNAAINYDTWQTVLNADLREVHETFEANLFGAWRVTFSARGA
jgi:NAD(P)-dependent dehydrogenase (short-subunit alcohol dehydrogenase family)